MFTFFDLVIVDLPENHAVWWELPPFHKVLSEHLPINDEMSFVHDDSFHFFFELGRF